MITYNNLSSNLYSIPKDIVTRFVNGYLLVISPNSGKWLVIENQLQADMLKDIIHGYSFSSIKDKYITLDNNSNIDKLIYQIYKKNFGADTIVNEDNFTLRLYVTNKCNLRCQHCFMYSGKNLKDELSLNEIINLLHNAKNNGCNKIIISGGEISERNDLFEIIKCAYDLQLYIQIMTNGVNWPYNRISQIAPYIDEVQISIDGYDDESNAKNRGIGSFTKTLRTIEYFYDFNNVYISVISSPYYDDLLNNYERYLYFSKLLLSKYTNNFIILFNEEIVSGRNIIEDKNSNKYLKKLVEQIHNTLYPNFLLTNFINKHRYNLKYYNCGYGTLTINSNGDYHYCSRVHESRCYGNIRSKNFDSIVEERKVIRKLTGVDNIIPCKSCDIRYICGGGCKVSNCNNLHLIDKDNTIQLQRECNENDKNRFYELMLQSNDFLIS